MAWFRHLMRFLIATAIFAFVRLEVRGREHIPAHGKIVVVVNHLSNADPPILDQCFKRKVFFMAKQELFRNRIFGLCIQACGAFPVRRDRIDTSAVRQAQALLAEGNAVALFPEGKRSPSGTLQPGLAGPAMLARQLDASILPAGITGTEHIRGFTWFLKRPHVVVNFGPPFHLPKGTSSPKNSNRENTELIMRAIACTLPPEYRGIYNE
ncbi:lysophospholipid acyltransferase family protein [Chloroflexota bacterium]